MTTTLTIGTRGSKLALWQAEWAKTNLESRFPEIKVVFEVIKTKGDKILDVPLAKVGGKGLFVKEIETALLEKRIDLAVHSMKDMPAELPSGLCIGAVPARETPFDVLVSANGDRLSDLPAGARIGTSSLRRGAQLKHLRPDLHILPLRGNLDTRLKKVQARQYEAIVLAAAGMKRMGVEGLISEAFTPQIMLPAVGQGALCLEIRQNDPFVAPMVSALNHPESETAIVAERAFLRHLEGGCQVPIAAFAQVAGNRLAMEGLVAGVDGAEMVRLRTSGDVDRAAETGVALAESLLSQGADAVLAKLREMSDEHPER